MNWFYRSNSEEIGPLSEATLRELHSVGAIPSDTPVRAEDSGEWIDLARLLDRDDTPRDEEQVGDAESPEVGVIKFHCPACQQSISAERTAIGQTATCPSCNAELVVGEDSQLTSEEPPDTAPTAPPTSPERSSPPPLPSSTMTQPTPTSGVGTPQTGALENLTASLTRIMAVCVDAIQKLLRSEKTRQTLDKVKKGADDLGRATTKTAKAVVTSDAARASVTHAKSAAAQVRTKVSGLGRSPTPQDPPLIPTGASEPDTRPQVDPLSGQSTQATAEATIPPLPSSSPKKSDGRFRIGVLVALGCTALIVVAIIGSGASTPGNSPPSASQPSAGSNSNYRSPCRRCRGSGQLMGKCRQCYGAGTIMTKSPRYGDIEVYRKPMQVPCPQCRGGGRMPVPCTHCRGTGR